MQNALAIEKIIVEKSLTTDDSEIIKLLTIKVLNLNTKVLELDLLAFRVHVMALNAAISSFHIGDKGRVLQEMTKIIAEFAEIITKEINNITSSINEFTKQVVICSNSLKNYEYFNKSGGLLQNINNNESDDTNISNIESNITLLRKIEKIEENAYKKILGDLSNIIMPLNNSLDNIFNNVRIGNMIAVNVAIETKHISDGDINNGGLQSLPDELKYLCEGISTIIVESRDLLLDIKHTLRNL